MMRRVFSQCWRLWSGKPLEGRRKPPRDDYIQCQIRGELTFPPQQLFFIRIVAPQSTQYIREFDSNMASVLSSLRISTPIRILNR